MNVVAVVAVAAEAVPVAVAVAVAVSAAAAVAVAVAVAAAVAVPGAIFGLKVPAMVECRLCRLWLRPRVGRVNAPRVRLQHGGVYEGGGGGHPSVAPAAPTPAAAAWGSEGPLAGTGAERPPSFSRGDTPLGDLATHLLACRRGGRPYVFCLYSYVLPGRGARAEGGPGGALCRVGERGGAREAHCCPAASICARLVDGAVPGVAHRASRSARRPPSPSPSPRARSSSLLRASEVADEPRARAPPAPARPPACTG